MKLSGDIHPNAGPPRNGAKYPCGECLRSVRNNQDAILCAKCDLWFHARCLGMSRHVFKYYLENHHLDWECASCSLPTFSDSFFDQSQESFNTYTDAFTTVNNRLQVHPGLKIAHINVNGLKGKLSEIRMLLLDTCLDIIAVSETKLANDITYSEIAIEGYLSIRKDRDRNGGGVLLYYKDSLTAYEELKLHVSRSIEGVWINVRSESQTWLFACVYRPPLDLSFYDLFNVWLEHIWSTRNNIVIMGDFNSDLSLKSKDGMETHLGRRLLNTYGF